MTFVTEIYNQILTKCVLHILYFDNYKHGYYAIVKLYPTNLTHVKYHL